MEFTKKFLRAKSPCADGFRWFIHVAGSIIVSQGMLQAGGNVRADWGVEVGGDIACACDLRAAWDVVCHGKLQLNGGAFVGQDLIVHGPVECDKGLVTTRVRMRYRPGITTADRIVHEGKVYSVTGVADVHSSRRELVLMCRAIG